MNGDRVDAQLKSKKAKIIFFKRRPPMQKQDFTIENHGSVVIIRPNTPAGINWANEHIGAGNGFQPYWPAMLFEPRYVDQVIGGIQAEGLTVR
jgi:hypothetical protein